MRAPYLFIVVMSTLRHDVMTKDLKNAQNGDKMNFCRFFCMLFSILFGHVGEMLYLCTLKCSYAYIHTPHTYIHKDN